MAVATYSPHARTTGSWLSHNPFSSRYTLSSTRGIAKSSTPERRCARLEELLAWVEVIPFGIMESRCAAWIRADLEKRGEPIGPMDILIAGTAFAHDAELITRNQREFSRIQGLRLGNWYE